jgi:hypothetical protein
MSKSQFSAINPEIYNPMAAAIVASQNQQNKVEQLMWQSKPQSQGVKNDSGKPDLSMVSYELVEQVAFVRMFGAKKYARDNWKLCFLVTRSCAAALRHIFLFLSGETNDSESGLSHLAHAVCSLEHAIYTMKHKPELDDREKAK